MRKTAVSLAFCALSACATTPPPTLIPVPVSCVKGDLPAEPPLIADKLTGNAERDIGIVGASAKRLRAWGHELRAMLEACKT